MSSGKWDSLPPMMAFGRTHASAARVGDKVYVFGGAYDSFDIGSLPSCEVYNVETATWSLLPNMPCPRDSAVAVALGNTIFLFGGYYIMKNPDPRECFPIRESCSFDVSYNVESKKWKVITNSSPRSGHAAVSIGTNIYVFGGYYEKHLSSLHVYHMEGDSWTTNLPDMPTPRSRCTAVAIGTTLYVLGGENNTNKRLPTVEAYEVTNQTWSRLPPMLYARVGCRANVIRTDSSGPYIFVNGGNNEGCNCEMFDFNSFSWKPVTIQDRPLPCRSFHISCNLGCDKILLQGGNTREAGREKYVKYGEILTLSFGESDPSDDGEKRNIQLEKKDDFSTASFITISGCDEQDDLPTGREVNEDIPTGEREIELKQLSGTIKKIEKNRSNLLYIDASNYLRKMAFPGPFWSLKNAQKKVKEFCSACKTSGYAIVAFIDQSAITEEAIKKWKKRREREIMKGKRDVPQGALHLLGDMIRNCGVEVRYSIDADNDDTLAYYAHVDGAHVLSADKDFLRYRGTNYKIFKDYSISSDGKLSLIQQDKTKSGTSWRNLLSPPPKFSSEMNPFRDCTEDGSYIRGSPSPLVQLGNLHITLRPLRSALYFHLGITSAVTEEFPTLSTQKKGVCVWVSEDVLPDKSYLHLLKNPNQVLREFHLEDDLLSRPNGVSKTDWRKYKFAIHSIIAEICSFYTGDSMLGLINKLQQQEDTKKDNETQNKTKQISHYKMWKNSQKTGESNKQKRERYLELYPEKVKDSGFISNR